MSDISLFVHPLPRAYQRALEMQEQLHHEVVEAQGTKAHLLLGEHDSVFTLGKHGEEANMLFPKAKLEREGIPLVRIARGGDITYHGPGQLVGYPILSLPTFAIGVREYIARLLEAARLVCASYGVEPRPRNDAPGLWLGNDPSTYRKICAVGVHVSQGVSTHGFALNVNTNLDYFGWINPCGFHDGAVTSLARELRRELDFEEVTHRFVVAFCGQFGIDTPSPIVEPKEGKGDEE